MTYSKIIGSGSYLPEKVVTNYDLEKTMDTNHAWIVERTGIHQRHIALATETASSMGAIAAKRALMMAELSADAIDLIVVATTTPDSAFPSTACLLQEKLGCKPCIAFDVTAACAGFIYALSVADQFIRSGMVKTALVVGSELMSRTVNWNDRGTAILFGDGAGAILLTASDQPGIHRSRLLADGRHQSILYLPQPIHQATETTSETNTMKMQGADVFKQAVQCMTDVVLEIVENGPIQLSDVDWLIPHQANLRIMKAIAKRLDFPLEKVIVTVDQHANTSAASVSLAFDQAVRDGRIQRGHRIILEGFGGGLTWGAVLLTY
jgi:3-oxoacyl-[acyl-carrier-protein] synthase-3